MNYQVLSYQLRNILKARAITYKDLANHLGMTESGIKKLLTGNDISVNKLERILKYADVEMQDLLDLSKGVNLKAAKLTKEQEQFLAKSKELLNLTVQLAAYDNDLEFIKKLNPKLSKAKLNKMLKDLSDLKLIELEDGKVIKAMNGFTASKEFRKNFLDPIKCVINSKLAKGDHLFDGVFYVELNKKSSLELKIAMQKLVEEFVSRSERELKIYPRNELNFYGAQMAAVPAKINEIFPLT